MSVIQWNKPIESLPSVALFTMSTGFLMVSPENLARTPVNKAFRALTAHDGLTFF
jgi:hypothetical protein